MTQAFKSRDKIKKEAAKFGRDTKGESNPYRTEFEAEKQRITESKLNFNIKNRWE